MYVMEDAIGVSIVVYIPDVNNAPFDLAGATTTELIFKRPDGQVVTKPGTIANPPGTDGKLKYTTVAGDLQPSGNWRVQGHVVKGGLNTRGTVAYFDVFWALK